MSVVIVLILIAAIVAFFVLRSGENLRFETSSDPHRVVMAAVGIIGAKRRWQTMAQSDHGANFLVPQETQRAGSHHPAAVFPDPWHRLRAARRQRESLVLTIDSGTAGMTVVQVTSNGFRGKTAGRALQQQVSVPAGALGTGGSSALTARSD